MSFLFKLEDLFGKLSNFEQFFSYLDSMLKWMLGFIESKLFSKETWLLALILAVNVSFLSELICLVFCSKSFVWLRSLSILFISMKVLSIFSKDSFDFPSSFAYLIKNKKNQVNFKLLTKSKKLLFLFFLTFLKMFLFSSSTSCFKESVVACSLLLSFFKIKTSFFSLSTS